MTDSPLPLASEPKKVPDQNNSVWYALGLAWELGYLIAIPIVVFGFAGAYLDKYLHTSPLFIILGFVIAITCSFFFIRREIRTIVKQ